MNGADDCFMRLALEEAALAAQEGEVPVGAVLVQDGQVVARAHNQPIARHDPSAHAEVLALRAAAAALANYRLPDCTLYVSLEPCVMCAGAIFHARLARVVFAAYDQKTGAAGSALDLFSCARINHQTEVQGGVLIAESKQLLHDFFEQRRCKSACLHGSMSSMRKTP